MRENWHFLVAGAAVALIACPVLAQGEGAAPSASAATAQPSDPAVAALVAGDYAAARKLAEPRARKGDGAANHLLGYLYQKGLGVHADIGAALRYYGDAAIVGNVDAQLALGILAYEGDGVYPDYERAAGWFRLAAAQGDARADIRLGLLYAEGAGVAEDRVAAANHFARAAAKGDADGAFWLGLSWLNGDGLPQSYQKAATNFKTAAAKGHGEAAYHLALLYEAPVLGAPDTDQSVAYMKKAAESGYAPAFAAMGLMVHRGDAEGLAADWFEKGARAGDSQSAFLYAVALSEGDGRVKDILGAMTLIDQLIASRTTPPPIKAQAATLKKAIQSRTPGPLTLRN